MLLLTVRSWVITEWCGGGIDDGIGGGGGAGVNEPSVSSNTDVDVSFVCI